MKKLLCLLVLGFGLATAETPTPAGTTASAPPSTLGLEALPFKLNALLQAWAINDNTNSAKIATNFRLRRAELKLSGNVVKSTRFFVMADLAKTISPTKADNSVLQDLGIGFTILPGLEILAGQFKTPTDAEGLLSSAELLLPERSRPGRMYGDRRDPGVMATYELGAVKLAAMVSNGTGPNQDSTKSTKDLSLRTDVTLLKPLKVGAFVQLGDFQYASKGRWGVNTRYAEEKFVASAEYMMGQTNGVNDQGFMVDAGYFVTKELQPVARYEFYRKNVVQANFADATTLGLNYVLGKNNAKIQAAYSYLNNMKGENGDMSLADGSFGSLFNIAFQMAI